MGVGTEVFLVDGPVLFGSLEGRVDDVEAVVVFGLGLVAGVFVVGVLVSEVDLRLGFFV